MRWINLAEQLPDFPLHKALLRVVGTNSNILTILAHWYKLTDKTLTLTDREVGAVWGLDELEWLDDESAPDIPEGYVLVKAGTTGIPDGYTLVKISDAGEELLNKVRAEQHKQTLFNALDFIEPYWTLTDPYLTVRGQMEEILSKVPIEKQL